MTRFSRYIFIITYLLFYVISYGAPSADPRIEISAHEVAKGHTLMVAVNSPSNKFRNFSLLYGNKAVKLFKYSSNGLMGFVPINYDEKKRNGRVSIYWREGNLQQFKTLKFEIIDYEYPVTTITVKPGKVILDAKAQVQIKRDREETSKIYKNSHNEKLWKKPFKLPVNSVITSHYGARRVFNDQVNSVHQGLDLRAPEGTPIKVMSRGIVRLARETFYGGNTVIVDHGLGFFSTYSHLSKINVKVGQWIHQGKQVGLSGSTGRVNGPHLHWGLKLQGNWVSPMQFVKGYQGFTKKLLSK